MSIKTLALATCTALAISGAAFGVVRDWIVINDMQNVVAQRLEGSWVLDADTSRALDPNRFTAAVTAMSFEEDASVLARLQEYSSRFAARQVYMAGMLTINRAEPVPFVITSDHGNPTLTWFTPNDEEGELGVVTSRHVAIVCSRGCRNDWLCVGGDAGGLPCAIYKRTQ